MIKEQQINQPNLFESNAANAEVEKDWAGLFVVPLSSSGQFTKNNTPV